MAKTNTKVRVDEYGQPVETYEPEPDYPGEIGPEDPLDPGLAAPGNETTRNKGTGKGAGDTDPIQDPIQEPGGATVVDDHFADPPTRTKDPKDKNRGEPSDPGTGGGTTDPGTGYTAPPTPRVGGGGFAGAGGGGNLYIDPATGSEYEATTREVQNEELTSWQLNQLLDSDSVYMQRAAQRGLAAANARGGVGGTLGAYASMRAAIDAGLPVAQQDAAAFREAASQNMNALNQFGLANMQRATQIAMANLDSATRIKTTAMNNASQQAIARLQAQTTLMAENLRGEIQARLAEQQFQMNQVLNAQAHGYNMEQTALQGEYNLANIDLQAQVSREGNYINAYLGATDVYYQRLDNLNGQEMDQAARTRAENQIYADFTSQVELLNLLFPDRPPISLPPPPGG